MKLFDSVGGNLVYHFRLFTCVNILVAYQRESDKGKLTAALLSLSTGYW